jgi:hypothetical protein
LVSAGFFESFVYQHFENAIENPLARSLCGLRTVCFDMVGPLDLRTEGCEMAGSVVPILRLRTEGCGMSCSLARVLLDFLTLNDPI